MALLKSVGITAPPRTWDEFAEDCRRVTRTAGGHLRLRAGQPGRLARLLGSSSPRGGDFARADGKGYALATPQMKATLLFMQGLVQQGVARKIPKRYDDQTEFGSGLVAFTLGSTSGLTFYDRAVKANKNGPFAWTIAPIPQLTATASPEIDLFGASVSVTKSTAGEAARGMALHQVVLRAAPAGAVDACVQLLSRPQGGRAAHQGHAGRRCEISPRHGQC